MLTTKSRYLDTIASLKNGEFVSIRSIKPDDAPCLQALFRRLSPDSIYYRFLEYKKTLSYDEAIRLAEIDCQKGMALAATDEKNGKENIIAVARYEVFNSGDPGVAEAAIVVEDRYQRLGLGTILLDELATYASAHGIRTFSAVVHNNNVKIMRFIQNIGSPVKRKLIESGVWEIQMKLAVESKEIPGGSHVQNDFGTTRWI